MPSKLKKKTGNPGQETKLLQVYLKPEEHRMLKVAAAMQGVSMSDLVKQSARQIIERQAPALSRIATKGGEAR
jgi:uncharacterized protein (DUF1778 family)